MSNKDEYIILFSVFDRGAVFCSWCQIYMRLYFARNRQLRIKEIN